MITNWSIAPVISAPSTSADSARGPVLVTAMQQPDRARVPADPRAVYFMHGTYAVARAGRPRLTAPDLLPDRTRAARPGARRTKARIIAARG